jgi:hypothetical protein
MLVRVYAGQVHTLGDGEKKWARRAEKLAMGPYHNVAHHIPAAKAVLLGGGNGSHELHRLDSAGKLTACARCPAGVGIGQSINWADPSGELLVLHKDGKLFAYAPATDRWREVKIAGSPLALKGSSHHVVAVPLPAHGVTMLFTSPARGLKVVLYKHMAE